MVNQLWSLKLYFVKFLPQISKDDFDTKARSLLGEGNLHLHNEFLFAILVKCQTGALPGKFPINAHQFAFLFKAHPNPVAPRCTTQCSDSSQTKAQETQTRDIHRNHSLWSTRPSPVLSSTHGSDSGEGLGQPVAVLPRALAPRPTHTPYQNATGGLGGRAGGCGRGGRTAPHVRIRGTCMCTWIIATVSTYTFRTTIVLTVAQ